MLAGPLGVEVELSQPVGEGLDGAKYLGMSGGRGGGGGGGGEGREGREEGEGERRGRGELSQTCYTGDGSKYPLSLSVCLSVCLYVCPSIP